MFHLTVFGDTNVHFDEHNCFKKDNQKMFFLFYEDAFIFLYLLY